MSKYSLQNECLENIEAFSDEQMNREMAVIESVLDIFDKTILMMELSNSDADVPDCSMFMESTFFQEQDPQPANGGEGGEVGQPTPAAQDGQQQNNGQTRNNGQKTPPTEAERKKYNSEHQFRQMNKKGNTENMFISIIAFIPRFFGFIIQCIVKLIKKITNKNNDEAIKNSTENAKNLTDEQKQKLSSVSENQTGQGNGDGSSVENTGKSLGTFNINDITYNWWDQGQVIKSIDDMIHNLSHFDLNNIEEVNQFIQFFTNIGKIQAGESSEYKIVNTDGNALVACKNEITNKLNELDKLISEKYETLKGIVDNRSLIANLLSKFKGDGGNDAKAVLKGKQILGALKIASKQISDLTSNMWNGYEQALKSANIINGNDSGNSNNNGSQPQQPQAQPPQNQEPQPQPPVNNVGGENNGGQNQNSKPNA